MTVARLATTRILANKPTHSPIKCGNLASRYSLKECVWTIASSHQKQRSELYGQTLTVMMDFCSWTGQDRIRDVLWSVNPAIRSRDLGLVDCNDGLLLMDRSITPAGHCDGVRGGTRHIPAPSHIHHSLVSRRSSRIRTSNL